MVRASNLRFSLYMRYWILRLRKECDAATTAKRLGLSVAIVNDMCPEVILGLVELVDGHSPPRPGSTFGIGDAKRNAEKVPKVRVAKIRDRRQRPTCIPQVPPAGEDGVSYCSLDGFADYLIGDDGTIWHNRDGVRWEQRKRRPGRKPNRYAFATLQADDGTRHLMSVHVLVLTAFRGPRPDGLVACHEDDVKDNNRLSNLRWDTQAANWIDMIRNQGRLALAQTGT
jgi:hypothetical protein